MKTSYLLLFLLIAFTGSAVASSLGASHYKEMDKKGEVILVQESDPSPPPPEIPNP